MTTRNKTSPRHIKQLRRNSSVPRETLHAREKRRYPLRALELNFLFQLENSRKNGKGEANAIGHPQNCQLQRAMIFPRCLLLNLRLARR
jgi:hypothetical protein